MLPEEVQALAAKVLLFIFATFMLCMAKTRANPISVTDQLQSHQVRVIPQQ